MIQVTCALIIDRGKVLLTQNNKNSDHPFQWEFPGGKVKPRESEEQCICREINEELELEIRVVEPLFAVKHDYGFKKIRLIPFVCSISSGTIKLNNHYKKEWVEIGKLKTVDFSEADKRLIEIPENKKMLEKYFRK